VRAGCGTRRLTAADNETAVPDAVATAGRPADHGRLEAPSAAGNEVRNELRASVMADESRLGQVYRCLEESLDADATLRSATLRTPASSGTTGGSSGRWLTATYPQLRPLPSQRPASSARSRKMPLLTGAARTYLGANLEELERRANDADRREEEVQRAQVQTQVPSSFAGGGPQSRRREKCWTRMVPDQSARGSLMRSQASSACQ
jgi:hypothetical protein